MTCESLMRKSEDLCVQSFKTSLGRGCLSALLGYKDDLLQSELGYKIFMGSNIEVSCIHGNGIKIFKCE